MELSRSDISHLIKNKARELGFVGTGITSSATINERDHLEDWLRRDYQANMNYLAENQEKRLDPSLIHPGSKSIISLLFNYYPENELRSSRYKIARYAYGKDYHKVLKKRLKKLTSYLEELKPGIDHRVFVDSAPVMERQLAARAGLGWIGKNGLLINREKGSYFFLAEVFVDVEMEYDTFVTDHCGNCTACLDACPTNAFPQPYVLDASKCISYATIELRENEDIPELFRGKMKNWIYGCDICQEVCPWNRFSVPTKEEAFFPKEKLTTMKDLDWEKLDNETYDDLFAGSAVKRAKFSGLKRNIRFASGD